jgi:pimeloyl-ACP methyl ester carboxylesterase
MRPETNYAKSGQIRIAYQVTGDGPIDMVWAPGTVSHLDLDWDWPPRARFFERLSSSFRLIRFDKRGTGLSDRPTTAAMLEERMDDIRAVMDAVGSQSAAVFGLSEGGSMACLFAATYPARTRALLLWGVQARWTQTTDYPWGVTREEQQRMIDELTEHGVTLPYILGTGYGLGKDPDPALLEWCFRYSHAGGSPSAVAALERMNLELDTRDVLPAIRVPTLVMNRTGDPVASVDAARDLCSRIPGALFREWPGATHGFSDLADEVIPAIEEFVAGTPSQPTFEQVLATILCVDIVKSKPKGSGTRGPARRNLLPHVRDITHLTATTYRGRDVKKRGDGFLAVFDGPTRAIQCARSIQQALGRLGLETRVGLLTGECTFIENDVGGAAVDLAVRIAAVAEPGEILVSSTVRDLVASSGIHFEDRGPSTIPGLVEERPLFRVVARGLDRPPD